MSDLVCVRVVGFVLCLDSWCALGQVRATWLRPLERLLRFVRGCTVAWPKPVTQWLHKEVLRYVQPLVALIFTPEGASCKCGVKPSGAVKKPLTMMLEEGGRSSKTTSWEQSERAQENCNSIVRSLQLWMWWPPNAGRVSVGDKGMERQTMCLDCRGLRQRRRAAALSRWPPWRPTSRTQRQSRDANSSKYRRCATSYCDVGLEREFERKSHQDRETTRSKRCAQSTGQVSGKARRCREIRPFDGFDALRAAGHEATNHGPCCRNHATQVLGFFPIMSTTTSTLSAVLATPTASPPEVAAPSHCAKFNACVKKTRHIYDNIEKQYRRTNTHASMGFASCFLVLETGMWRSSRCATVRAQLVLTQQRQLRSAVTSNALDPWCEQCGEDGSGKVGQHNRIHNWMSRFLVFPQCTTIRKSTWHHHFEKHSNFRCSSPPVSYRLASSTRALQTHRVLFFHFKVHIWMHVANIDIGAPRYVFRLKSLCLVQSLFVLWTMPRLLRTPNRLEALRSDWLTQYDLRYQKERLWKLCNWKERRRVEIEEWVPFEKNWRVECAFKN